MALTKDQLIQDIAEAIDAHDRAVTEVFAAVRNDAGVGCPTHPHGSARGACLRFLVKDYWLFIG